MEKPESYHYNYQSLDEFLRTDSDPKELGDQLDQLMADLVNVSRRRVLGKRVRRRQPLTITGALWLAVEVWVRTASRRSL